MIAQIVINRVSRNTDKIYDYKIPDGMDISVGNCVIVPFGSGNQPAEGYVMGIKRSGTRELKEISSVKKSGRAFDEKMLELIYWMREKYLCSFMDIIKTMVPSSGGRTEGKFVRMVKLNIPQETAKETALKIRSKAPVQSRMLEVLSYANTDMISSADLVKFAEGSAAAVKALCDKGWVRVYEKEVYRNPLRNRRFEKQNPIQLNDEQIMAYNKIKNSIMDKRNEEFLLRGVTGSGKTEVFMSAIESALEIGRQAIVLVPEISLTPQMIDRFLSRFGDKVAVFHSNLSLGERYDEWRRMRDGDAQIVIGARSAVFAPFKDIGIIIMDEEHSETYKSDMSPRYHTKEVAQFRAAQNNAALLLASATPSAEDYKKALDGKYTLLEMVRRANKKSMPPVTIVDMRNELNSGNKSMFSRLLHSEIEKNLQCGEQTILMMNRRGFSTFVSCRNCGFVEECPNCSISLTYHKSNEMLRCHYCGYTIPNPKVCPVCSSKYIRHFGGGTQRVEEEIKLLFPRASTLRMDVDTTETKESHEKILNEFRDKNVDILIGTQMVAKGLDFENVTLVGVVSADTMLHINDYRSGERTFALLEQVTGRAGRGKSDGRAVVQTYNPEHQAIQLSKQHDYQAFYNYEILMRETMWYPPFCEIVSVQFSDQSKTLVMQAARFFSRCLEPLTHIKSRLEILGPIESQIYKINNKYRWQILIKCENSGILNETLVNAQKACAKHRLYKSVTIIIDKNPNSVY